MLFIGNITAKVFLRIIEKNDGLIQRWYSFKSNKKNIRRVFSPPVFDHSATSNFSLKIIFRANTIDPVGDRIVFAYQCVCVCVCESMNVSYKFHFHVKFDF